MRGGDGRYVYRPILDKMSHPQEKEKALKTFVVGESGLDAPLGLSTQETNGHGDKEPKRTWRSYIWSCKP